MPLPGTAGRAKKILALANGGGGKKAGGTKAPLKSPLDQFLRSSSRPAPTSAETVRTFGRKQPRQQRAEEEAEEGDDALGAAMQRTPKRPRLPSAGTPSEGELVGCRHGVAGGVL